MFIPRSRALLLDVDGVLLQHTKILNNVAIRADRYVKHKLSLSSEHGKSVNQLLYSSCGHTHLGMKHLLASQKQTIQQFNHEIYTPDLINYLATLRQEPEVIQAREDMQHVLQVCQKTNISVYIFSNAPIEWCAQVLRILDMPIHERNILSSDHDLFQTQDVLKPDMQLYRNVEQYLMQQHQDEFIQLLFVDDSFRNLVPIMNSSSWIPIFFSPSLSIPSMYSVKTLRDIAQLV